MKPVAAKGIRFVGHCDMDGRSDGVQIMVQRGYAYIGHGFSNGITTVDASAGGLGGCPYAKSATGNLATEDLLWQLHGLGIETGVDLHALVRTSTWMAEQLGRPSPSRAVQALAKELDQ